MKWPRNICYMPIPQPKAACVSLSIFTMSNIPKRYRPVKTGKCQPSKKGPQKDPACPAKALQKAPPPNKTLPIGKPIKTVKHLLKEK